jgi:hypothetical protein
VVHSGRDVEDAEPVVVTAQGVKVPVLCGSCGTPGTAWEGQSLRGGVLRWVADTQCANCGLTSCDGDRGETPRSIRDAVLGAHGPSRIRLTTPQGSRPKAYQVFRKAFGWSLARTRQELEGLAITGYVCTDVEAEYLSGLLAAAGVDTVTEKDGRGAVPGPWSVRDAGHP